MDPIPIYVAGLSPDAEGALLSALDDLSLRRVAEAARAAPDAAAPGVAVVALDGDPDGAFRVVSGLSGGGVRVAVVASAKDPELILRAMRAGAREFVVAGEAERLALAVRALVRPGAGAARSEVTAIFGAKGGMGATTVAANVAAACASRGGRTCLVDLDLRLGDVLSVLDLQGGYTIGDVLANLRRLDRDLLDSSIARHRSGVSVLAQGERIEEADAIDAAAIGQLIGFLRQHYGHVLLDGLRGFGELSLAALDAADRVVVLVSQEVPAIRDAQRCVAVFRRLGYGDRKLVLVVNRFQPRSNVTREVIAETVGLPVAATIANDYALLAKAVSRGGTVAEEAARAPIAGDMAALAGLLGADEGGAAPRAPWWRRLLRGANGAR
jgi:pilus assembly protein CpaE